MSAPSPRAEAPVFLQRPETPKPIPELSFPLPPRTPPLPGGHALPLLTSGQWVDSPPEFYLFVGYCNFHLSNVHGNQWGEGSEEVLLTVKFLLLLPLLHFYLFIHLYFLVAPRDRITFLGICHLCIDSSRSTTTKEEIPRQNIRK